MSSGPMNNMSHSLNLNHNQVMASSSSTTINNNLQHSSSSSSSSNNSRSILIPTNNSSHVINEDFIVRVLTLNCWGLWFGAKKRAQRIAGIVRYLRENNCDIVFLQEVWVTADFEFIRDGTKDIYRFAHLFRSGSVLGSSGIVILCKWQPKDIHFEPYSLNGSPFYPWHGDWFAGKGIAYSRVDFNGLSLHLFCTHTHAYYKEIEPHIDQYYVHRVCQSYQLARFITFVTNSACHRRTNGKDLIILAGDMNSTSSELPYRILTTMAGLTDCFKKSRRTNHGSNIIHKHKLMSFKNSIISRNNDSISTTNVGHKDRVTFYRNKLGDNYLMDTINECRRIAHSLFESDTDDEDITYCHPRNSFTPTSVEYKPFKFTNSSSSQSTGNKTTVDAATCNTYSVQKDQDDNNQAANELKRETSEQSISSTTYVAPEKNKITRSKKSPMKRIDFILCRLLTHGHCVVDRIATECKDPTLDCSLSDHEPVMVELTITDVSHDLLEKNFARAGRASMNSTANSTSDYLIEQVQDQDEQARSLASLVESKGPQVTSRHEIEETTDQWVPETSPVSVNEKDCNVQVLEATQDVLIRYHKHNKSSKTQLFYLALLVFLITLPTTTYYALSKDLLPISTVVFIWFAASVLLATGLLVAFLCYRTEQGAIEATINDISCRIASARDYEVQEKERSD